MPPMELHAKRDDQDCDEQGEEGRDGDDEEVQRIDVHRERGRLFGENRDAK
jgi:hypothetical protein